MAGLSGGGQATVLDFNEVIDLPLDAYLPTSKTKFRGQGALGKTTPPSIKTNAIIVKEIGQACFQREEVQPVLSLLCVFHVCIFHIILWVRTVTYIVATRSYFNSRLRRGNLDGCFV